jgi:secernin
MCDTIVALGNVTEDGVTLFGKNSDREPNEAHHLIRIPAADHPAGSRVKCTYIEIPQVEHTYEILLAKPFWIWGAEMGTNEHGVTIGNEAVFTKVPYDKKPGLIGMDFLRLALERSKTARQALDVITQLLAAFGQGGNCGFQHQLFYHNSYLIADPSDAWVLETAGQQWAAEQVKDIRTISNRLTIGNCWDIASDDLIRYAVDRKWCKSQDDFDFARCYSDFIYSTFSKGRERQCRSAELLKAKKGALSVGSFMEVLRDHGPQAVSDWSPDRGLATVTICWHAGFGPIRGSQSTGSMISHLGKEVQTHFVTGTSAPCTGLFKPVWLGADLPDTGPVPSGAYDKASLFWRHETLHRATLLDFANRLNIYKNERDSLEKQFVAGAMEYKNKSAKEKATYSRQCFSKSDEMEAIWTERVNLSKTKSHLDKLYASAWKKLNSKAKMP